jgi:hypothetical protein
MHRSLILTAALSALAAGPALAQEGGLDTVEMSITIDPVTDIADVDTSTGINPIDEPRPDDAGDIIIQVPVHNEPGAHDGERDHEAAGDSDPERDMDHERDMDRGTDLDMDHDHGDLGGDVGGDVGGDIDMPDAPDSPDTVDTGDVGDVESGD